MDNDRWRINKDGEIELLVKYPFGPGYIWCPLNEICLWCGASRNEDCGTDCPGTSDKEYEQYAKWLLEGVPLPDGHPGVIGKILIITR